MQTTSCSTVRRAPGGRAVASAARPAAASLSAVRQAAAAAAAAALLLSSTPAFAVGPPPSKDAAAAALAEQLKASLNISEKKTKQLAGVAAPSVAGKKAEGSSGGGGFSFPSFSFGTEPSSSKPAVAPGPAEPSEGPSPLLLAALVLFSPLLVVQAVQLQTLARVASQALGLAQEAEPTGTVKRVVKRAAPAAKAPGGFTNPFAR